MLTLMVAAQITYPLTVEELSHKLGEFSLGPIDLALASGQCIALVGGNGAGKSTLLRCIAGLISPRSGTIRLSGLPSSLPLNRRQLAYLPERFSPPHYLAGREFLNYYLGLCNKRQEISSDLLRTLLLDEKDLSRPVRKLSKGTAQKLGLAAVLSTNRPVLIMDEPFSGLDPEARLGLRTAMADYARQGGCLFFSTHLFEGMDDFVARMVILHAGQVRFDGSVASCRNNARKETLEQAFLHLIHQS